MPAWYEFPLDSHDMIFLYKTVLFMNMYCFVNFFIFLFFIRRIVLFKCMNM